MLTYGSLFSGIGGIDLGLDRAGLECRWQVELDPYARRVLAKHWPHVRRHDDVRTFPPDGKPSEWAVDLIAGGFPCEDISFAGRGAGIDGERSGLWADFARIVRVVRPAYVLVENVPALLRRGMDRVLGDLAALGFDAEWECIPAASFGAPHLRERLFILAYANGLGGGPGCESAGRQAGADVARGGDGSALELSIAAHAERLGRDARPGRSQPAGFRWTQPRSRGRWAVEPGVGRVADGVPHRVDRVACLGRAVVPDVAEWLGMMIVEHTNRSTAGGPHR